MIREEYNVGFALDDLDGHEHDRIIKIKLADGTVKDIDGIQFLNACIGGDDIIYITELDPIRSDYEESVQVFIDFVEEILEKCNKHYHIGEQKLKDNFDCCFILDIQNEIAKECDNWFKWLKLDIKYEPGCGSEDEVYFKINILKTWLKGGKIPKEVPTF